MKIELEYTEGKGWRVATCDRYAEGLNYEETLGLLAAMLMYDHHSKLDWLKTEEEHKAFRERLKRDDEISS